MTEEDGPLWTPGNRPLVSWGELCKIFENKTVQRRHPGWFEVLQSCAVFDITPVDLGADRHYEGSREILATPLPFPEMAIIYGWAIFIVREFWYWPERSVFGADYLVQAVPYTEHQGYYSFISQGCVEVELIYDGSRTTTMAGGEYTDILSGKPRRTDDHGETTRPYRKGEPGMSDEGMEELHGGLLWNMLQGIWYINQPSHFIVADSPKKTGKAKKGTIPRLHSRPRYILLDKEAIHQRYLESQPSGRKSPMPHLRRGHYRTLASNRYKEPGKKVWVRATNVKGNDVQWRRGDRFYKVI